MLQELQTSNVDRLANDTPRISCQTGLMIPSHKFFRVDSKKRYRDRCPKGPTLFTRMNSRKQESARLRTLHSRIKRDNMAVEAQIRGSHHLTRDVMSTNAESTERLTAKLPPNE